MERFNHHAIPPPFIATEFDHTIAVNANGAAVIAWNASGNVTGGPNQIVNSLPQHPPTTSYAIFVSTITPGGLWSQPYLLESFVNDNGFSQAQVKVAVDPAGHAVVVWYENNNGSSPKLMSSTFISGVWSNPILVVDILPTDGYVGEIQLGVDASGNALLVYAVFGTDSSSIPGTFSIFASALPFGSKTWSSRTSIATDTPISLSYPSESIYGPILAMNLAGQAIIAWAEPAPGDPTVVYTSTLESGVLANTWGVPVTIQSPNDVGTLDIAMNHLGQTILAWQNGTDVLSQTNGNIFAVTTTAGESWSLPVMISQPLAAGVFMVDPAVAINAYGNIAIIWVQSDSFNFSIQYNTMRSGFGWNSPQTLYKNLENSPLYDTQLILDISGYAVAAWGNQIALNSVLQQGIVQQGIAHIPSNGGMIQASVNTDLFPPFSPTHAVGLARKNTFLTSTVYSVCLTWELSPSPNIANYLIYDGSTLVGTISATSPLEFHTRVYSKQAVNSFRVIAVDIYGGMSAAIPFVVTIKKS